MVVIKEMALVMCTLLAGWYQITRKITEGVWVKLGLITYIELDFKNLALLHRCVSMLMSSKERKQEVSFFDLSKYIARIILSFILMEFKIIRTMLRGGKK